MMNETMHVPMRKLRKFAFVCSRAIINMPETRKTIPANRLM